MDNKGNEMWWIIITGIIALVAVILIVLFFRGSIGKTDDTVGDTFEGFGDKDCDKTSDFLDSCPCDKEVQTKEQLEKLTSKECATKCDKFVVVKCDN